MNKQLAKKKKKKNGFTLIELIVVISILGILAAIAVPRLGGFTTTAQTTADETTASTIMSAFTMWQAENVGTSFSNQYDEINAFLSNVEVAENNSQASGSGEDATTAKWGFAYDSDTEVVTITSPAGKEYKY